MNNEDKPIMIIEDQDHTGMFRLLWEDGVLSEDFYNATRANDILNNYDEYRNNMTKTNLPRDLKGHFVGRKAPYSDLNRK